MRGKIIVFAWFFFLMPLTYAWNANGHRLIAQIAYDNLSTLLQKKYVEARMLEEATYLDHMRNNDRYRDTRSFHYIDIPFSADGTRLFNVTQQNAVTALKAAMHTLQMPDASFHQQRIAYLVVLHVVGDLHQPLHAATRVSADYPHGDKGGNLSALPRNRIGANVHAYWDAGGGYLLNRKYRWSHKEIKIKAIQLERRWPCERKPVTDDDIDRWARESHKIASTKGYPEYRQAPLTKAFKRKVRYFSQKQIAMAGCRLAQTLTFNYPREASY